MAFLKNIETEEIFHIDKKTILLSNKSHSHLQQSQYKVFQNNTFQTKHAAIIQTTTGWHQIVDLCSEGTSLKFKNGNVVRLQSLKFFDLEDEDQILIGNQILSYHRTESSQVIGLTQFESQNEVKTKKTSICIPETEDFDDVDSEVVTSEELADIELPATPEMGLEVPHSSEESGNILMETQAFSDEKNPLMETEEFEQVQDENLDIATQPFWHLPPTTRNRSKQQNAIKPSTRSLLEFEATQSNFSIETEPVTKFTIKQPLRDKVTNKVCKKAPPRKFRILDTSSESESDKEEEDVCIKREFDITQRTTDEIPKIEMTPPSKKPSKEKLFDTPEFLPQLPSQSSNYLNEVNCSQEINDDSMLEFKEELESEAHIVVTAPVRQTSSFKRNFRSQLELVPKKKVKFMKYADSDDD